MEQFSKCNHCHKTLAYCSCERPQHTQIYKVSNLDCANCALKIEDKLKVLPAVKDCSVSYPLGQLKITSGYNEKILPEIQSIARTVESDVEFTADESQTKTFPINGLDCAACSKKIEDAINKMPQVQEAVITYETGKLKLTAKDPQKILPAVQRTVDSVEDGVTIGKPKEEKVNYDLLSAIAGTIIFVLSWVFESQLGHTTEIVLQLMAYLLLGGKILWKAVKNIGHKDFFDENTLLVVATIAAFAIGDFHEAVGVLLFFRIGEFFEDYAVKRSREQISDAVDLRPETVILVENGTEKTVAAETAQIGDHILIRPGDRIPLDGKIIDGNSRLDTSAITGEPVPRTVRNGDELLSGSVNLDSPITLEVTKPLSESLVTKILESVENAAANKPQIDRFITRFSKIYTPVVVLIAALIAIIPPLIVGDWHHWIYTAVTFLVISCPCALVLSVPLSYFCGIGAAGKLGILFKGGNTLEIISNLQTVIFDKTGTLTNGDFKVQDVRTNGVDKDELLRLALTSEKNSTHPIAVSIKDYAKEQGLKPEAILSQREVSGKGMVTDIENKTVFCGNKQLLESNGIKIPESFIGPNNIYLAQNGEFLGAITISDTIKKGIPQMIEKLKRRGLKTAMLSGDHKTNATLVAGKVGIDQVYAELLPQQKLEKLNMIRQTQGPVMYVGDGINDAPVLAGAEIGAAVGKGSDMAIEAADLVFLSNDSEAIDEAIDIGHYTKKIAWENVYIALFVKFFILFIGLIGFANMWLAVFADTGVTLICILNSLRILFKFRKKK